MHRRRVLYSAPLVIASLAGCTSGDGTEGNGDANETPTSSEPKVEEYLDIRNINWISYRLRFTVENVSDTDLGFVQVDSAVYENDTRIGTYYTNIGEIRAGTKVNAEIDYTYGDVDGSLCDGTRFTLTPTVTVDIEQYEHTYEYPDANICGGSSE